MRQYLGAHQVKGTVRADLITTPPTATSSGQMFQTFAIKNVGRVDGEIVTGR